MTNTNAFSPEEAPGVQLIVQMRLYDVLMAVLTELNSDLAANLIEAHAEGRIVGPLPSFKID